MADNVIASVEKEKTVKKLKRELEGWREVILQINSVLLWDKNWYPGLLAGITSSLFLLFWMLDPSLLTTASCICLFITVLDYIVPAISSSICNPANWTAAKEKQLEDICKAIVNNQTLAVQYWSAIKDLKVSRPKLYYPVVILILAFLAWIGNEINNLVLTYLIVTASLMLPGLKHHGILQRYFQIVLRALANILRGLNGHDKLKTK